MAINYISLENLKYYNEKIKSLLEEKQNEIQSSLDQFASETKSNLDQINSETHSSISNFNSQLIEAQNKINSALDSLNCCIIPNNFKVDTPSQGLLTSFAISCMGSLDGDQSISSIPIGTKIKNTYNNHIWILNKYSSEGLNTYKWEDLGSDSIGIANNEGAYGLVTGSKEDFKGFIDVNGIISINGLEEEFQNLIQTIAELTHQINGLQEQYQNKLTELENRLKALEENG